MLTAEDKVKIYEELLHRIHTCRCITLDGDKIKQLLDNIDAWSIAYAGCNGLLDDKELSALVEDRTLNLNTV